MSEFIGSMIIPSPDDIRYGIGEGASGVEFTGNFILPPESSVLNGIGYGSDAIELSGTYISSVTISQNLDLFIYNKDSINENIDLLIKGSQLINNSLDLFNRGYDVSINGIDLFTHGFIKQNNNFNLFIDGNEFLTDNLNLFIYGKDNKNQNLDVFIHGLELINNHITLSIHGTISGLPLLENGDDNFGLTLDQLFKNADYNPQIIGRFIGDPNSVTIEMWNNNGDVITLTNNSCYQIGDTGRWAFSTINLPPLMKIVNQFIFRMTGDNAEVFESQFILHTRRKNSQGKVPRNNSHIRKI